MNGGVIEFDSRNEDKEFIISDRKDYEEEDEEGKQGSEQDILNSTRRMHTLS